MTTLTLLPYITQSQAVRLLKRRKPQHISCPIPQKKATSPDLVVVGTTDFFGIKNLNTERSHTFSKNLCELFIFVLMSLSSVLGLIRISLVSTLLQNRHGLSKDFFKSE
jgi:hypothetical protein